MSAAVAMPPVTASPSVEPPVSARTYAPIAPSVSTTSTTPSTRPAKPVSSHSSPNIVESSTQRSFGEGKRSPNSTKNGRTPKIIVKKEPSSPDVPTPRHRPQRLDLSNNMPPAPGRPSAPLTSKESAGLAMQDVGLACLSPGFHTQDPSMREQLQRSIDVRERQRQIIEARQKGIKAPGDADGPRTQETNPGNGMKEPGTTRRKGPPPGLSIAPPSHQQFASERVIQSAPLNQSFTGLGRQHLQPLARQIANQPSSLSHTSHIHHVPATQTNNRLPPIADVFAELPPSSSASRDPSRTGGYYNNNNNNNHSPGTSSHSNHPPPLPSPGFPPSHHHHHHQQQQLPAGQGPASARPREYKSAEEAVASLSGGREDLLPRIVHYGGHQPPTPPSPAPGKHASGLGVSVGVGVGAGAPVAAAAELHRSGSGSGSGSGSSRRRGRDEYEHDMGTPPLGRGAEVRRGPFDEGRDSPETQRRKKEEFMALCARAWDLFHS